MIKITAMSTICADIFDSTGEIRPGGEALNFAAIASKYSHIKMNIIAGIGDDDCGNKAMDSIKGKNIDTSCIHIIEGGKTASNRIYLTPAGERYFKSDSWNGGVYQEFSLSEQDREKLQDSDIVFINYYSPNFTEVLESKREYGYQLAVDFDIVRNFKQIEKIASQLDYFFISGEEKILPVFKKWSEKYDGLFNITLAQKGSVSYFRGEEYRVKAVQIKEIVDTTGCGDSYHAGFIGSYTAKKDIMMAMIEGSTVASKTLSHIGGFE